jgi:hypothetical protein
MAEWHEKNIPENKIRMAGKKDDALIEFRFF